MTEKNYEKLYKNSIKNYKLDINTEYAKTFSKNLRNIMNASQKTQADMSRDLKISKTTLSSWMNGYRMPRMSKVDLLCHYFNCSRYDLLENDGTPMMTTRLSPEEVEMVEAYRMLNARGKSRVTETVHDLLRIDDYTSKDKMPIIYTVRRKV